MSTKLRTLPVTIDADKIAEGMLEMFTEEERTVLRFGMLPAKKMEILEKQIRESYREKLGITSDDDNQTAMLKGNHPNPEAHDFHEFSLNKLVSETVHEIGLALYKIGDLVV